MNVAHQAPNPQQPSGGVTELVLTGSPDEAFLRLLPMLAHITHTEQSRWLTWITPHPISPLRLLEYNIDLSRLRVIRIPTDTEPCDVLHDALACGTSHTVLASPGLLSDGAIQRLDEAARQGKCQGLLVRLR